MKKIAIFSIILTSFLFSCKNSTSVKKEELKPEKSIPSEAPTIKEKQDDTIENNSKNSLGDFDKQEKVQKLDEENNANDIKSKEKPLSW